MKASLVAVPKAEVARVVVVGSANLDVVVPVPRHPTRGETVLGGDHRMMPGGKGANQAVAAARLDADVIFVGRLGDDAAGDTLGRSLADAGVDITLVRRVDRTPSGLALITVDPSGDNAIVVSPGANHALTPAALTGDAEGAIANASVLLLQLEIPTETVLAAATMAQGIVVLDPAPAPDELPPELLEAVDVLVPNETELAVLAGLAEPPASPEAAATAARTLGVRTVVVTLGARGALIVDGADVQIVTAPEVAAVDTTGAGDAFRAALAVALLGGDELADAVRFATRVGAATVLAHGAQPSLPTRADIDVRLSQ